jgi:hypothetical protein
VTTFHIIRLNKHEQAVVRLLYLNYLYHRIDWASNVLANSYQAQRDGTDIGKVNKNLVALYHDLSAALPMPIDTVLTKVPDRIWKFDAKRAFYILEALKVYLNQGASNMLPTYQKKMLEKVAPPLKIKLDAALQLEYSSEEIDQYRKGSK